MAAYKANNCCDSCLTAVGTWLTSRLLVRSTLIVFIGIALGCLLTVIIKSNAQQYVVVYLYLAALLVAFILALMTLFFALKLIEHKQFQFVADLACGAAVGLFAILVTQQSGCKQINNAFSIENAYCPTLNTSLAFGILTLPFYLSGLLMSCGCIGKSSPGARQTQGSAAHLSPVAPLENIKVQPKSSQWPPPPAEVSSPPQSADASLPISPKESVKETERLPPPQPPVRQSAWPPNATVDVQEFDAE